MGVASYELRSLCPLKMVTMKARVEVRSDSFACNVRHGAPCSYQCSRTLIVNFRSYVRYIRRGPVRTVSAKDTVDSPVERSEEHGSQQAFASDILQYMLGPSFSLHARSLIDPQKPTTSKYE